MTDDDSQELLAACIALGATVSEAAKKVGVSQGLAQGWFKSDAFQRRLRRHRLAAMSQAMTLISQSMTAAAKTLQEAMQHGNGPTRFNAARLMLELGLKSIAIQDLKDEQAAQDAALADFEKRVTELENGPRATAFHPAQGERFVNHEPHNFE